MKLNLLPTLWSGNQVGIPKLKENGRGGDLAANSESQSATRSEIIDWKRRKTQKDRIEMISVRVFNEQFEINCEELCIFNTFICKLYISDTFFHCKSEKRRA